MNIYKFKINFFYSLYIYFNNIYFFLELLIKDFILKIFLIFLLCHQYKRKITKIFTNNAKKFLLNQM